MLEKFEAYQLALRFYRACKPLKVPRQLRDQLLRASASVVLRECQAILDMEEIPDQDFHRLADRLGGMLFVLSRKPLDSDSASDHRRDTDSDSVVDVRNRDAPPSTP